MCNINRMFTNSLSNTLCMPIEQSKKYPWLARKPTSAATLNKYPNLCGRGSANGSSYF
jgi:hypothetical protein